MRSQGTTLLRGEKKAKKGKAQEGGSSTRVPKEEVGGTRPQYREIIMNTRMKDHYQYLSHKPVTRWNYIDLSSLNSFECRTRVERLIHQPYWSTLFACRYPTYTPVVHEFVASLEFTGRSENLTSPTIRFHLFNNDHYISVNTLGKHLGFYTRDDQSRHWYRRLPRDFGDDETLKKY